MLSTESGFYNIGEELKFIFSFFKLMDEYVFDINKVISVKTKYFCKFEI